MKEPFFSRCTYLLTESTMGFVAPGDRPRPWKREPHPQEQPRSKTAAPRPAHGGQHRPANVSCPSEHRRIAILPKCGSMEVAGFFFLSFFTTPSVRPGPPGSYYGRSGPGPWPPPVTYLSPRRPLLCLCSGGAYGNLSKATGEVVLNGVLCTSLVTDLAWSIAGHRAGVWALCGHHRGSGLPEVAASCEAQSQWEPPPSP